MDSAKRVLELKLTEPQSLRVHVGQAIPVSASVLADNILSCEVSLKFDELVIEEMSGRPNPRKFSGSSVADQVQWELRAKQPISTTFIEIEAWANGLFQMSQFALEVI